MPFIQVDPGILGTVATQLTDSVAIARDVHERRDTLKSHVANAGHEVLRFAVHSFLDTWGYGCGCLTEDAEQIAERLRNTSRLYLQAEESIEASVREMMPAE